MPTLGETAFFVTVHPRDKVEAGAVKHGWKPEGDYGPMEYVEPENYAEEHQFKVLDAAIAFAKKYCADGKDFWGVAYVERATYRRDNITPQVRAWKSEHRWEVNDESVEQDYPLRPDDDE